jgi:hypothetical protein
MQHDKAPSPLLFILARYQQKPHYKVVWPDDEQMVQKQRQARTRKFLRQPNSSFSISLLAPAHPINVRLYKDINRAFGQNSQHKLREICNWVSNARIAADHSQRTTKRGYLYYKNDHIWTFITNGRDKVVLYQDELDVDMFIVIRYLFGDKYLFSILPNQ